MFKKIIVVLSLLLLVSCSAPALSTEEISTAYQQGFTCIVTAVYGGDETAMEVSKNGANIRFCLVSPEELAGLNMEISGGKMSASFEGMGAELDFDALPESGPLKLFCLIVETLSLPDEFSLGQSGKDIIVIGRNFSAKLDPNGLGLLSAEFPNEETEFTFSEWAFSEQ